jgi:methyltransferase (TIGR00027 family)
MKEGQPSATAQRAAVRRAAHQLLDEPKVFDDPLALRIIGQEGVSELQTDPYQQDQSRAEAMRLSLYLRAYVAARSRYAEDELALAVERGVSQYIILGAGLDTFAYRNPYPESALRVFEVDHPATQAWKRARLKEVGVPLPRNLKFAPLDFEKQTLAAGLREAGYNPNSGAFFSWLGVTPYLTIDGVMTTLRFIASAPKGSGVIFDYAPAPSLLPPAQQLVIDALAKRLAAAGEPLQTFFDPSELMEDLRAMGFRHVEDIGPEELNARYFKDRTDGLRVGILAHMLNAQV